MSLILDGTNGLSDVDGTAAAPAIRGTDANTGIFFPAADQVAITTGGTQRAVVDASGNVGIGTASPAQKLSVNGADGSNNVALFTRSGGSNMYLYVDSGANVGFFTGSNAAGSGVYANATSNTVQFNTNGSERARIDSSGNVIIGGTTSSAKLTVFSDISLRSGAAELSKINGQTATSVSTSATNILAASFGYGALAIVNGYSGAAAFCDLVFFGNVTASAVSSQTVSGSPAARTYTAVSGQLKLAMASGTYSITAVQQYINAY